MNDAHVYEMQVQMWKPNTWGVTALLPYKNLVRDLKNVPLLIEFLITAPQIIFSFPRCIAFTTLITPHDFVELDHPTPSHSLTSVNHSNQLFLQRSNQILTRYPPMKLSLQGREDISLIGIHGRH